MVHKVNVEMLVQILVSNSNSFTDDDISFLYYLIMDMITTGGANFAPSGHCRYPKYDAYFHHLVQNSIYLKNLAFLYRVVFLKL